MVLDRLSRAFLQITLLVFLIEMLFLYHFLKLIIGEERAIKVVDRIIDYALN